MNPIILLALLGMSSALPLGDQPEKIGTQVEEAMKLVQNVVSSISVASPQKTKIPQIPGDLNKMMTEFTETFKKVAKKGLPSGTKISLDKTATDFAGTLMQSIAKLLPTGNRKPNDEAALEFAESLNNAIVKVLPEDIRQPVSSASGQFMDIFKRIVKQITPLAKDIKAPSIEIPDINIPKFEIPDLKVPSFRVPDIKIPSIDVPDIKVPSFEIPDLKVPDLEMPTIEIPSIPAIKLPGITSSVKMPSSPVKLEIPTSGQIDLSKLFSQFQIPGITNMKLPDFSVKMPSVPYKEQTPKMPGHIDISKLLSQMKLPKLPEFGSYVVPVSVPVKSPGNNY